MKLWLHVGTPKTGTTSIRGMLHDNRDWLATFGIHPLRSNTIGGPFAKHKVLWQKREDPSWDAWREEIRALPSTVNQLMVSNESLFRASEKAFNNIRDFFQEHGVTQTSVIIYVRDQAQYFQSHLLQKNKAGDRPTNLASEALIEEHKAEFHDYLQLAERYERVFGAGCVRARLFDRNYLKNGEVVADFLDLMGLPENPDLKTHADANVSLTADLADIMFRRREELAETYSGRQVLMLVKQMARNGVGSKYFLTEEQVGALRDRLRESNALFAERYLENADAIVEKPVWVTGAPLAGVPEIERRLLDALDWAPEIHGVWKGRRDIGERIFVSGWVDTDPRKSLRPAPDARADEHVMRFYAARPSESSPNPFAKNLRIDFKMQGAYAPEVTLNGAPLGRIDLSTKPIEVGVEATGPLGEVELRMRPVEGAEGAPVIREVAVSHF